MSRDNSSQQHNTIDSPVTKRHQVSQRLRLALWLWHRRIGFVAALFVVLLSITGIAINHSESWQLNRSAAPALLQRWFYHLDAPDVVSFNLGGSWVSQINGGSLYIDTRALGACSSNLVGAAVLNEYRAVLCEDELMLFNVSYQLVERLDDIYGLPTPINAVALCSENICFRVRDDTYRLHTESLSWQQRPTSEAELDWLQSEQAPQTLRDSLIRQHLGDGLSWERFLLDLHSGRIFGAWGPWLMDLMAVLFVVLAISGISVWSLGRRRKRN